MLHEVINADTRKHAEDAIADFATRFGSRYEKATECLVKDREALLTLYDFPAEHWKHLRTTNAVESPFATVRWRQRVIKGAGSRTRGLLMAFKLLDMAQLRWRRLNGSELLPVLRAGVQFIDGVQQERDAEDAA